MSIEILTLIMLGSMVLLLVIGLPLAFVTGLIAFGFALCTLRANGVAADCESSLWICECLRANRGTHVCLNGLGS